MVCLFICRNDPCGPGQTAEYRAVVREVGGTLAKSFGKGGGARARATDGRSARVSPSSGIDLGTSAHAPEDSARLLPEGVNWYNR